MSSKAWVELNARGFVKQCTDLPGIEKMLESPTTFYMGIDPTGDSLHVGHLLGIMEVAHLQRDGHKPIVLLGGFTAEIGDPSGKLETRKMLPAETVAANAVKIRAQLNRFLKLDGDAGLLVNNNDWLRAMTMPQFQEISAHFRVNEMLRADCYREKMERQLGLTLRELTYQVCQAVDFLHLSREHDCSLQIGGDDQWSNILAGRDLIRKLDGGNAFGLTFPLLTTAGGVKMGKTEAGAIWLDPVLTTPYDFYQFWRNVDDRDVRKLLLLLTFVPLDEIEELCTTQDSDVRIAKLRLAFEVTKLVHGEQAALGAVQASEAAFGASGDWSSVTAFPVSPEQIRSGLSLQSVLISAGLSKSRSEARRLIEQRGVYVNGNVVGDIHTQVSDPMFDSGHMILRAGKKKVVRVVVSQEQLEYPA